MLGASWRTGIVGLIAIASGVAGLIADIIAQQGMPKTIPEYFLFGGLVLGGIGHLLAKDAVVSNSGTNAPAHDVLPLPVVLLALLMGLSLTACASYIDLGDGHYGVTRVSEERSPFGTNAGFMYLENCKGESLRPGASLTFAECVRVTDVLPISSQGQGGQITAGAVQAMGLGILGAQIPATTTTSSASSTSSLTSAATAPAHGGHH